MFFEIGFVFGSGKVVEREMGRGDAMFRRQQRACGVVGE
jgi:hypothetical protein